MSDPATKSARRRELLVAWLPAALYMALIWVMSSMPVTVSVAEVPFRDKGVHFAEYLVLAVLLHRALGRTRRDWGVFKVAATAFGMALAWGYLDELHQAFVPSRDSSALDVLADGIGSAVGACAMAVRSSLKRS